jgi:mannose/cellobiose epimerase-like protein (N-acyl-D-glucosamine 2-epimerase family)
MSQHVLHICGLHEIELQWGRGRHAHASHQWEFVVTPAIKSAVTYAIALHEIGHVLGRNQLSRRVIVRERWAWNWARLNALFWTAPMERVARRSMEWYEHHGRELQKKLEQELSRAAA